MQMNLDLSHQGLILVIIAIVLLAIYKHITKNFDYWRKRNVPGPEPKPFIGNLWDVFTLKYSLGCYLKKVYDSYNTPFVGIYTFGDPGLLIRDPHIAKQILVKDFNYFQNRVVCAPDHNELISNLLFFKPNPGWKPLRDKLTTVFSSGKMKNIFYIMNNVAEDMVKFIETIPPEQDVKKLFLRYSTELVTQAFYGVRSQCFEPDESVFYAQAKLLFGFSFRNAVIQTIYFFKGHLVDVFKLDFFYPGAQKFFKDAFWKCLKNVEGVEEKRFNLITILGDLKKKDSFFTGDKLVAQGMMFYTAGTETTSSTIAFTLYELCMNPDIQDKLRLEILEVISKQGFNYESLKEMKYLDMCVQETLRKYPSLPFLDRKCSSDYQIPGTDLIIEKDVPVYIPMLGLQNDEKYFPNPDKYIPERFQQNVNAEQLIHFPFGFGPRFCIGERFGLQGTKIALVNILTNFSVEKGPKTPTSIEIDPRCITLLTKGGLTLKFKKLNAQ